MIWSVSCLAAFPSSTSDGARYLFYAGWLVSLIVFERSIYTTRDKYNTHFATRFPMYKLLHVFIFNCTIFLCVFFEQLMGIMHILQILKTCMLRLTWSRQVWNYTWSTWHNKKKKTLHHFILFNCDRKGK